MLRLDSRFAFSLSVASLVSLAVFACSSPALPGSDLDKEVSGSKNGEDEKSDTNVPGRPDATAPSNNNSNPDAAPNPPSIAECTSRSGEACYTCCEEGRDLDKAFGVSDGVFRDCTCGGVCATQCGDSLCTGQAPTEACDACLYGATQCRDQAKAICLQNEDCKAISACYDACDAASN